MKVVQKLQHKTTNWSFLGFFPTLIVICSDTEYYSNSTQGFEDTKQGTQNCGALELQEKPDFKLVYLLMCYFISQTHGNLPFAAAVQGHLSMAPLQGSGIQSVNPVLDVYLSLR